MGRRLNAIVGGALVLGLAAAGCGGSGAKSQPATQSTTQPATQPASTTTSKEAATKEHLPTVNITLAGPAFRAQTTIPARYTCDGADISPPMQWSAIPSGTAELVLTVSELGASAPGGGESISWAVAGLQPTLQGIAAGTLPPGAIVGRNSHGQTRYSVCPPKGDLHHYIVALYALPHTVPAQPGFAARALVATAERSAEYKGLAGFTYKRT